MEDVKVENAEGQSPSKIPPAADVPEAEVTPSGGHGEKKERMKEQAIAALLDQPSISKAARTLGISENTLASWMKDPAFAKEYREARDASLPHAIDRPRFSIISTAPVGPHGTAMIWETRPVSRVAEP